MKCSCMLITNLIIDIKLVVREIVPPKKYSFVLYIKGDNSEGFFTHPFVLNGGKDYWNFTTSNFCHLTECVT